ncbi:hypothetical protein PR048_003468 [Dryococelus australis]|uniref:Vps16 N-terminal domain-containing protein n=1 Tax=Dryococelus australis TaxID=614101 RepID=A0ABQ9IN59_9NEOP|nr:hypothetical protein PR048_003468 [Dryococelus australis]
MVGNTQGTPEHGNARAGSLNPKWPTRRNHRADEYVRLVKDQLDEAVGQCIKAAGYEFDPENQKMLMKAAQFGKCFIPDVDSEPYVKMCRTLRVLNAVRNPNIGIPSQ